MIRTRRRFLREFGAGFAGASLAMLVPGCGSRAGRAGRPDALFVVLADTHSAYDRYPGIVAAVRRVREENPGVPLAVLFNGDLFERGNPVALRSAGEVDLRFVSALSRFGPVIFNVGNHEGALSGLEEAVAALTRHGACVVSNLGLRSGEAGAVQPLARPDLPHGVGTVSVKVAGIGTDDLATYRAELREGLAVVNGPEYAAARFPETFAGGAVPIVLSHEGVADDRGILPHVPDGTLVVGGHDHLRFTHRAGRTLYLHTGAWGAGVGLVSLRMEGRAPAWEHREVEIPEKGEGDPELARVVHLAEAEHLAPEDLAVVARTGRALPMEEAARLAADAIRVEGGGAVGMIANTTFGSGLPAGEIALHRFHSFLRFDNELFTAEVDGDALRRILGRANQFGDVPFAERTGEFLVAAGPGPGGVEPEGRYRIVVDGWVRANALRYLEIEPEFEPLPGRRLREVVAGRLAR